MRPLTICSFILICIGCAVSDLRAATPGRERGATSQVRIEGYDPLIPTLRKWYVPQDLFYYYQWGDTTHELRPQSLRALCEHGTGRPGKIRHLRKLAHPGLADLRMAPAATALVRQHRAQGSPVQQLVQQGHSCLGLEGPVSHRPHHRGRDPYHSHPLTFSRARFNGVQWDFASDKYYATLLLSRVSQPILAASETRLDPRQDYTNLIGLRSTAQLGDFVELGVSFVNTHFGSSRSDFSETSLAGLLPAKLNSGNVTEVIIRISDDSPGTDPGRFFSSRR